MPGRKETELRHGASGRRWGSPAAYHAIGFSLEDHLDWLMRFAERRFDKADEYDAWEVQRFMSCAARAGEPAEDRGELLMNTSQAVPRNALVLDGKYYRLGDACGTKDVSKIQRLVRQALKNLRDTGRCGFAGPIAQVFVWRSGTPGVAPYMQRSGSAKAQFASAMLDLFSALGERLRLCEGDGCERFFAAKRPHQRFCSTACGNRVHVKKWRREHAKDAYEQRQKRYQRAVSRKTPGAKVTARPRKKG